MESRPLGIDVSRWQGVIDWDKVRAWTPKVWFAGIRATIGKDYQDSFFKRNWTEAKARGIIRTAYHVVYPSITAERQMDNFFGLVGDDFGEFPLTLDLELDQSMIPETISMVCRQCAEIITRRTGRPSLIYSRAQWVDTYITSAKPPPSWLNDYDWWLAHYLMSGAEHPGDPPMPKGVDKSRLKIHQTSRKGDGKRMGMQSGDVDTDRWCGTIESMLTYALIKPNVPITDAEKLKRLWDAHPELHNL